MQKDDFDIRVFPNLERFCNADMQKPLRVCIATEEILGPVRNGGIASTYYHLAVGLSAQGHEVTVVLLKGKRVQQETLEYWQTYYDDKGVVLHYLDWPKEPFERASHPWQGRCLSFYQWLKNHDFDLVHTSEWRGGAYYALMAKRLGIAFQNTLFVVKASSPHIWNRHYQMQSIDYHNLYSVMHLEQRCIEWADMVIGGSAHLLSFMESAGYVLPAGRVFVQPNIVDFSFLNIEDKRDATSAATNLVFFGRLETRKGLELFCDALDKCVASGDVPDSITFLGKEGVFAHRAQLSPKSYIEQRAKNWPLEPQIYTDKGQPEALAFLCSDNYVAVMPSLIENSTMTVYEALVFDIPFLATDVGGTSELLSEESHDTCLVAPEVDALAAKLSRIIDKGQTRAVPAFNNEDNIQVWYQFHRYLTSQENKHDLLSQLGIANDSTGAARSTLCVINLLNTPSQAALRHYAQCTAFDEIVLVVNGDLDEDARKELSKNGLIHIEDAAGRPFGAILNHLVKESDKQQFVISNYENTLFSDDFPQQLEQIRMNSNNIYTSFFRCQSPSENSAVGKLSIPLGGDVGHQVIDNRVYGREIIFFTKEAYERTGEFDEYHLLHGTLHAYVTQAIVSSDMDLLVIPEPLFTVQTDLNALELETSSYTYSKVKAAIESLPLSLRKCLMFMTNPKASKAMRDIDGYTPDSREN